MVAFLRAGTEGKSDPLSVHFVDFSDGFSAISVHSINRKMAMMRHHGSLVGRRKAEIVIVVEGALLARSGIPKVSLDL